MENNNVNLMTINFGDVKGSIGIDAQIFNLLSQIIISDRQDSAERRKEYERRETARNNMEIELQKLRIKREELEIEKIKFQKKKKKFFFDIEKAERLSRKKENFNK